MEEELKESHWSAQRRYTKISIKVHIPQLREDKD